MSNQPTILHDVSKFTPIGDRVLVRHIPHPTMTKGGIHIPQSAQKKMFEGVVLKVGPAVKEKLEPGEIITWETFAGNELGRNDGTQDKHVVLRECDIFAVIGDTRIPSGTAAEQASPMSV